jgi:hypothetical protein
VVAADGLHLVYGALSGEPTPYPASDLGMPPLNMRSGYLLKCSGQLWSGLRSVGSGCGSVFTACCSSR